MGDRKNMLKTSHGLYILDETLPVARDEIQRVASWAARYWLVWNNFGPLQGLYIVASSTINKTTKVELSDDAANTIQIWRSFFVFLELVSYRV